MQQGAPGASGRADGAEKPPMDQPMPQGSFAADMQLHAIAVGASPESADDGRLIFLRGKPTHGDHMDEPVWLRRMRISAASRTRAERLGNTVGDDMELRTVVAFALLIGNHTAWAMDVSDIAVKPAIARSRTDRRIARD